MSRPDLGAIDSLLDAHDKALSDLLYELPIDRTIATISGKYAVRTRCLMGRRGTFSLLMLKKEM